jgi:hypothetical protein
MSGNKKYDINEIKEHFIASETIEEAFVRGNGAILMGHNCLHYTTLSRLYQKLATKRWWLTRSDSVRLNDAQECRKYGDSELLSRTFQGSFSLGAAESAAMWVLYNKAMPHGVMVSIGKKAMNDWRQKIKKCKMDVRLEYPSKRMIEEKSRTLSLKEVESADLRDVIYAATSFSNNKKDNYDKKRRNTLTWLDVTTREIENLDKEITCQNVTGWIKDYEWRHENETRISVRLKKSTVKMPEHISIAIPEDVIKSMRFTLSPWLSEKCFEEVASQLRAVISPYYGGIEKVPSNLVRRSSIAGALDWWLKN